MYNVIALGVKAVPICWEYKQTTPYRCLKAKIIFGNLRHFSPRRISFSLAIVLLPSKLPFALLQLS